MEIVDVNSIEDSVTLGIHPRGAVSGLDKQFITFGVGWVNSTTHKKEMTYTDVDRADQTVTTFTASAASTSYYQHTYTLEIYDYLQQTGSDSVSRATWQWKLKEDGTTIFESHDGTSQIESRFAAAPTDNDADSWCQEPRVRITHSGFDFFSNSMEFDNLKLSVNGDDSCVPTAPPV